MRRLIRPCLAICAALLVACGSPSETAQLSPATASVESVATGSQSSHSVAASIAPSLPPPTVPSPPAAAASLEQSKDWIELSPTGKGFSVLMPGKPELNKQYIEMPFGRVPVSMYALELENMAYLVGVVTYPKEMMKGSDPAKMLPGAQEGAIKNVDARLVHEEAISLEGHPGRAFIAAGTGQGPSKTQLPVGGIMHGRLYGVNNQLYQVVVVGANDSLPQADIDTFFSSFKLTEK